MTTCAISWAAIAASRAAARRSISPSVNRGYGCVTVLRLSSCVTRANLQLPIGAAAAGGRVERVDAAVAALIGAGVGALVGGAGGGLLSERAARRAEQRGDRRREAERSVRVAGIARALTVELDEAALRVRALDDGALAPTEIDTPIWRAFGAELLGLVSPDVASAVASAYVNLGASGKPASIAAARELLSPYAAGAAPAAGPTGPHPAPTPDPARKREPRAEPVTDVWGTPLSEKRRRQKR